MAVLFAIFSGPWLSGCRAPAESQRPVGPLHRFEYERPAMGTTFRVVLHAEDPLRAEAAANAAFEAIAHVEGWASDYDPSSEVRRVMARAEAAPPGTPLPLSDELADHLAFALEVAEATEGAFDPTLGTLTRLWRRTARSGELPEPARLADARARAGFRHLRLGAPKVGARTLAVLAPGLRLDLGGSAKGEALDRALAALVAAGCPAAMVDGGGDVRVGAPPPGASGWRIEVAPRGVGVARRLVASWCAVATSGDAERHVVVDGVRYGHVLDPVTGLGATATRAAVVVASDGRTADALATAAVVAGRRALAWIGAFEGVEFALFEGTGAEQVEVAACTTAGFPEDGAHVQGAVRPGHPTR